MRRFDSATTASRWLAPCLYVLSWLSGGCASDVIDICNRMIECQANPCSVNQCTADLEAFSEAELADTKACFDKTKCGALLGGACPGPAASKALRCCTGTPEDGCELALCQDVPDDEPWPVQCLGEEPADVLCEWAADCELWTTDPPPSQADCRRAAVAYNDPARATEASLCRTCILQTDCDEADTCTTSCDVSLIP